MLEDSVDDAEFIQRTLRRDGLRFQSSMADTEQEFITGLKEFKPDIVLSDHSLPRFNSQAALKITSDLRPNIPFILVTGAVSEEFAAKILKQGADDYILKDNLKRLSSAILLSLRQRQLALEKAEADKKIREQKLELEKLNKELDNFIYSLSHDLKAPLNSVLGLINLVFLEIDSRKAVEEYLHKTRSSVNELENTLIEMQSYYSSTRLATVRQEIDINKLVHQCLEKVKYMKGFSTMEKRVNIQQQSALFSDNYRLGIIFNNLISNAVKYCDPAKQQNFIEIDIDVASTLTITFSDNGTGISEQDIDKIFDRHFKKKADKKSSGIGLYLVKEAVEKLGGTIKVESEPEQWTKFFIEIPNE